MAEIALGIGTSHGPLLNTPSEQWSQRAEADRRNPSLFFRGRPYSFTALTDARAAEGFEREITPERMAERHAACQRAIDAVADTLARVAPDTVVIIGDDQEEVFYEDNMPALSVYWGETLEVGPLPEAFLTNRAPGLNIADWGYYPPEPGIAPCEPKLGLHIIQSLIEDGFDIAHSRRLPPGNAGNHPVPHAYGFIYRRLMHDKIIPNVPVFINTFYPPNQPTLPRCYAFGQALRRAIESWNSDKRVAVMASGGLSHFVIEEDLDRQVLDAMQERDSDRLLGLPVEYFESGTSEIRNWIALAGAMEDTKLRMKLVDYVPCYRSVAGTGNAMAFAEWL
jgi:3-O-methylgallate 3,4-dioxygenase